MGDSFCKGKLITHDPKVIAKRQVRKMFTKFEGLSFYYNEVNKQFVNLCPAFYHYKICPLMDAFTKDGSPEDKDFMLNRVFEVEEYMGN